jgi:hypothetical protein
MRQKLLLIEKCKFIFVKSGKSIFHHVTRFFTLIEITRHKTALKKENEILRNGLIWIGAGLIAISLVILQGLLTLSTLDSKQTASLICFSLSIPLLASVLAILNLEILFKKRSYTLFVVLNIFYFVGLCLSAAGVTLAIWHSSFVAAILFAITVIIMYGFFLLYFGIESEILEDAQEPWD